MQLSHQRAKCQLVRELVLCGKHPFDIFRQQVVPACVQIFQIGRVVFDCVPNAEQAAQAFLRVSTVKIFKLFFVKRHHKVAVHTGSRNRPRRLFAQLRHHLNLLQRCRQLFSQIRCVSYPAQVCLDGDTSRISIFPGTLIAVRGAADLPQRNKPIIEQPIQFLSVFCFLRLWKQSA